MRTSKTDAYRRIHFELSEVRRLFMAGPVEGQPQQSYTTDPSDSWDENMGAEGAKEALLRGVQRQRLVRLANQLNKHLRRTTSDGHEEMLSMKRGILDRERYRQGYARCSWVPTPTPVRRDTLRIGVTQSVSAGVNSEVIAQRGAAVLALIRAAERLNVRLIVDSFMWVSGLTNWGSGVNDLVSVRLKSPGQALPARTANFVLAHAGFFRRAGFRLLEEAAHQYGERVDYGYGRPAYDTLVAPELYDLVIPAWDSLRTPTELITQAEEWTALLNKGR